MERVTQKDDRGYYLVGDGIYRDCGTPEKFRGDDVDRLAAYEDTGLEPEEIELLAKQRDLYVDACGELPLKRIRELAQADQEGQMVTQLNCPRKSDKSPLLIKQKCKEYIMNYCPNCNARTTIAHLITPAMLREAKEGERLDTLIHPFDEIDIPLDTGGTVTVVCGHVTGSGARFIFKDCWDEGVMNEEATNKGGYFTSQGRRHVLEDIWPHIAPEWQNIIVPRPLAEIINGEKMEYEDPLWLPSATDVFGPPNGRWWNEEEDSFQLQILQRERDRVKECGGRGTYPWWLRSVYASALYSFCFVYTGGSANATGAYRSYGFAPGFDI